MVIIALDRVTLTFFLRLFVFCFQHTLLLPSRAAAFLAPDLFRFGLPAALFALNPLRHPLTQFHARIVTVQRTRLSLAEMSHDSTLPALQILRLSCKRKPISAADSALAAPGCIPRAPALSPVRAAGINC